MKKKRKLNTLYNNFTDYYKIHYKIGDGKICTVYLCSKLKTNTKYAVKVIEDKYLECGIYEFNSLKSMQNINNSIKVYENYIYNNKYCFVLEYIDLTLENVINFDKYLDIYLIKQICKQLLEYLNSIHTFIIHTDIKPDNILFNKYNLSVKLIDYGNANNLSEIKQNYTYEPQVINYKSPEIIMGLPYHQSIDIWSLGCVIIELVTKEQLFNKSTDNFDHLKNIIELFGYPSNYLIEKMNINKRNKFFYKKKNKYIINESLLKTVYSGVFDTYIKKNCMSKIINTSEIKELNNNKLFNSFINKFFIIDPNKRWTAKMLLSHNFLQK
jgi:dual specificity protein kinase YAK1